MKLIYLIWLTCVIIINTETNIGIIILKTNQKMLVAIGGYSQQIEHLTMMGNLNSLFDYGNEKKKKKGISPLDMQSWLSTSSVNEFILSLEKKYNNTSRILIESSPGRYKIQGDVQWIRKKRGKGGGTWAHLFLLLKAAAWLDYDFELQVYETFVTSKILQWRDDSGEEFKNLNVAIDAYLPDRIGRDNKGCYIQTAKMLKAKIAPDGDDWNTATYNQLELRSKIETKLVDILKIGLVKDWNHFKEVINRL